MTEFTSSCSGRQEAGVFVTRRARSAAIFNHPLGTLGLYNARHTTCGLGESLVTEAQRGFSFRVLVVDDDESVRDVSKLVLASQGYEVITAENGFDALQLLRRALPNLIVSDLSMPGMSGFEFLSVVRRRFPHLPVIAISGAYNGQRPTGVLCDAYFTKAHYSPEELFNEVAELISESPLRPHAGKADYAPVWFPRSNTGYYVLTCTECLRSFSVPEESTPTPDVREAECVFCHAQVRYIVESRAGGDRKSHKPSK